jgi:atypical dual specificity phosphatase
VGGVINLMDEWRGPTAAYEKLGIEQLYVPTVDHVEPSVGDMARAVAFIRRIRQTGQPGVFIHCKGGHGRSAVRPDGVRRRGVLS